MATFAVLLFAALLLPSGAQYAVSIVSDPSTGPFLWNTDLYFHCSVDPLPPEPVTYSWRNAGPNYYSGRTQNFSSEVSIRNVHFLLLFCEVFSNGQSVGNASTFIETQGFIYTLDPQARSFSVGDVIDLRVNVSTRYYANSIRNLTWYHNGSAVESGDSRVTVNHTNLTIHSATPADAGTYQVKITSIDPRGGQNDACDSVWLPIIENHAAHAPVTFILTEGGETQYDSVKIANVKQFFTTADIEPLIVMQTFPTDLEENPFSYSSITWYHNGSLVDAERVMWSASYQPGRIDVELTIHNFTTEDTGVYEGTAYAYFYQINAQSLICYNTYEYRSYVLNELGFFARRIQVISIYFTVGLYDPPVLSVSAGSLSLLAGETTQLTCQAEGGNPSTHTLTWSKNGAVLATGTDNTLTTTSLANTFGEYTCSVLTILGPGNNVVDDLDLLLQEKGPMELQIAPGVQCAVWMENTAVSDVALAVRDLIQGVCSCSIAPAALQELTLTCSASGSSVIVTANLSYSDASGEVTASDLIDTLQTWLLTNTQPALSVSGQEFYLSRACAEDSRGEVIFNTCFDELTPICNCNGTDTPPISYSNKALAGSFIGGLCAGLILAAVAFGIVMCVFMKVRQSTDIASCKTGNEVNVTENSAYELTRYQTRETVVSAEEHVYAVPT